MYKSVGFAELYLEYYTVQFCNSTTYQTNVEWNEEFVLSVLPSVAAKSDDIFIHPSSAHLKVVSTV